MSDAAAPELALQREHRAIDEGIATFRASIGAADGPAVEQGIAALQSAIRALRRHIYAEEELLFPAMHDGLEMPMSVMLREHAEIWATLLAIEESLAGGGAASAGDLCDRLVFQLLQHNGKEEPIFYTRIEQTLAPDEADALCDFLQSGQMPPGWACRQARA